MSNAKNASKKNQGKKATKVVAGKAVQSKQVDHEFEFDLDDSQVAARGKRAAQLAKELGELEREFSVEKKEWQAEIEDKQAEIDQELAAIRAGKHRKKISCTMERDFEKREVRYVVGGTVLERRPMTVNETQMELEAPRAKKPATATAPAAKGDKPLKASVKDLAKQAKITAGLEKSERDNAKLLEPTVTFEGKPISKGLRVVEEEDIRRANTDVRDVIRQETNGRTKHSSADGARN